MPHQINSCKKFGKAHVNMFARSSGIALIEVLVAVLILAVGLLGMAAMQGVSTQMTNGAEQRTQAILLSADMMDRIRANRSNRMAYNNITVDPAVTSCATDFTPNNASTVSQNDIAEWSNLVVCLLPEGNASVVVNNASGVVTVFIDWVRSDPDGTPVILRTVI